MYRLFFTRVTLWGYISKQLDVMVSPDCFSQDQIDQLLQILRVGLQSSSS
jgi:hypothetical protein